jgi:polyferredoxin
MTVVEIKLPPHYLMCLGILFLPRWRMYTSEVDLALNDIFFSFPSLSFMDYMLAMKKNYISLSIFFSFDSIILLFTLIVSNWILFLISFLVV